MTDRKGLADRLEAPVIACGYCAGTGLDEKGETCDHCDGTGDEPEESR